MCVEDKITIGEVEGIIRERRIPFGENIAFSNEIDTSPCKDFFGKRCPHNIHVIERKKAHKDKFDPRCDWKKHLDEDVGIPHEVVPLSIGTGVGAAIGALVQGKRGAGIGGIVGFIAGCIYEIITQR